MIRFEEARLKIDRANKHITDVNIIIGSLPKRYTSRVERHHSGGHSLKFECPDLDSIQTEISLIGGDAIHNLRVSLDYAWVAIINSLSLPVTRWTKFPFADTAEKLNSTLIERKVDVASPALFKRLASEIKPYPGGNDVLCELHKCDIADKHKLLRPVINSTASSDLCVEDEHGNEIRGFTFPWDGSAPRHFDFAAGVKIKDHGKISVYVAFSEGTSGAGAEVSHVLQVFHYTALRVIESLESLT
jgi:hypothetical protein